MEVLDSLRAVILFILAPFRFMISLFVCQPKRSVRDDVILITGAAHGLGREMSLEFARLGATVVCWDINEVGNQETAKLASEVSSRKGSIHAYRCDVAKREDVMSAAERVKKEVGNVTMLINNAGILTGGLLETFKPEEIVRTVNVNYISHFWTIEAFLPHMKSINSGQIVCISSMSALMDGEFMVLYSSTKYAIAGLMGSLREELIRTNHDKIRVTTVYPTFTYTSLAMKPFKDQGIIYLDPSSVAKDIVCGVLQNKDEFSIMGWLMPFAYFLRCFPICVRRASKDVFLDKWANILKSTCESKPYKS